MYPFLIEICQRAHRTEKKYLGSVGKTGLCCWQRPFDTSDDLKVAIKLTKSELVEKGSHLNESETI